MQENAPGMPLQGLIPPEHPGPNFPAARSIVIIRPSFRGHPGNPRVPDVAVNFYHPSQVRGIPTNAEKNRPH